MRYEAVVFDLFGTLVPEFSRGDWDRLMASMAAALHVDPGAFEREWEETGTPRQNGELPTMRAAVDLVCRRLGARASPKQVGDAAGMRDALLRELFVPRSGTVEILAGLRASRVRTALVSNCTPGVAELFRASALARHVEIAVFSSEAGLLKPDPRIYRLATDGLGVDPSVCLYVGDGGSFELRGATDVGMQAVLLRDGADTAAHRPEAASWDGPAIDDLSELRALVLGRWLP